MIIIRWFPAVYNHIKIRIVVILLPWVELFMSVETDFCRNLPVYTILFLLFSTVVEPNRSLKESCSCFSSVYEPP